VAFKTARARLDEHLPQPASLERALEHAVELASQFVEELDRRIPAPGLVDSLRWQELAKEQELGSELGNAPFEEAEGRRAGGVFAGDERTGQLLEPSVGSKYKDQ